MSRVGKVAAFCVAFLAGTACHREVKKLETVKAVEEEVTTTDSVTTAPTERVTEKWTFTCEPGSVPSGDGCMFPGIGRALPGGGKAAPADAPGFSPFKGLGYVVGEYERVTEKLEPVAKTTTTTDKKTNVTAAKASDSDTDVGPGLKFYLAIAIALVLLVVGAYVYIKYAPPNLLASLVKKVLR